MRNLFFGNLATGHFSGKWMVSAAPPGHANSEYVNMKNGNKMRYIFTIEKY
jgi:hypothetical protein